jgi:hypothetical protein
MMNDQPGFDATIINTKFDLWQDPKMNWYVHPIGDCRNNSNSRLSQRKPEKYRGCIEMDKFYRNIAKRL